jgi:hypothetical protein
VNSLTFQSRRLAQTPDGSCHWQSTAQDRRRSERARRDRHIRQLFGRHHPVGTVLSGEENFHGYFVADPTAVGSVLRTRAQSSGRCRSKA